ncbi:helix-turn-helix domain-containing protein [Marinobacter nitratireducens]|nr:AraC family transcriptional regulator [Marinobacter nitratireducens]
MDDDRSNLLYLWPRRTLFVGFMDQPIRFSQAAASVVFGLKQPVTVRVAGHTPVQTWSVLLAPGAKVDIEPTGQLVAACYLDALGQDYRLLSRRMREVLPGVHGTVPGEPGLRRWLQELHRAPALPSEAYRLLEQGINPGAEPYPPADPRIEKVVRIIREQVHRNLSVEVLAAEVNLSVSRLVELFRNQVGVPIRRYRQWHRLFVTFTGVERGETLTDAAIAAGFTDSAHFSHTFRMTLGMKPSDILAMLSGRLFVDTHQDDTPAVVPGYAGGEQCLSH